jgi:hypothetical protein
MHLIGRRDPKPRGRGRLKELQAGEGGRRKIEGGEQPGP